MSDKYIGELVARIDERTANMEKRQLEEIEKREKLVDRVNSLENWRNVLVGFHGAAASAITGIGIFIGNKHK